MLFTLASMPKHGNISLLSDGTFVYYTDKDFCVTEECTVEITVAK